MRLRINDNTLLILKNEKNHFERQQYQIKSYYICDH